MRQVGRYGGGSGTHIIPKTEKENLEVHLGPTAFVTQSGLTFGKGDQIEVVGSRVKFGDADVPLAVRYRKTARPWSCGMRTASRSGVGPDGGSRGGLSEFESGASPPVRLPHFLFHQRG